MFGSGGLLPPPRRKGDGGHLQVQPYWKPETSNCGELLPSVPALVPALLPALLFWQLPPSAGATGEAGVGGVLP
jgi:hypothetical protein